MRELVSLTAFCDFIQYGVKQSATIFDYILYELKAFLSNIMFVYLKEAILGSNISNITLTLVKRPATPY